MFVWLPLVLTPFFLVVLGKVVRSIWNPPLESALGQGKIFVLSVAAVALLLPIYRAIDRLGARFRPADEDDAG